MELELCGFAGWSAAGFVVGGVQWGCMKHEIYMAVAGALSSCGFPAVRFSVEWADDAGRGEYACNVAMIVAKETGKPPREIADLLCENLAGSVEGVERVVVAGPGFLNFYLSRRFFCEKIRVIHSLGERWGRNESEAGREVLVEYSSPNLFKPLHVGNLVGTIVGESVARLFEAGGATVRRVTYPCDVGMTVAKAVWGLLRTDGNPGDLNSLGEAYRFGSEQYEGGAEAKREIEEVNAIIYGTDGGSGATGRAEIMDMYERGKETSFTHINQLCATLGTAFDAVIFESDAGPAGKQLVEERLRDGLFEEDDGAVIFRGEKYGLHTRVFLNSHGQPTYEAKELGNFALKRERYPDADYSVIVTGSEQKEYFTVLIRVMNELFGGAGGAVEHIATGFLTLSGGGGGGSEKMSSRKGNVLTGESLLADLRGEATVYAKETRAEDADDLGDQIAVSALKYQILRQRTGSAIVFDRQRAFSFEGDSGPYLQYTRARIVSVLEKAAEAGVSVSFDSVPDTVYAVERLVCRFDEVIEYALVNRSPHSVVAYATELAGAFNSLYGAERIADSSDPFAGYKTAVAGAVGLTLENALRVLGIPSPSRM